MFRETLIESSTQLRKRSGWPMAAALTLQAAAVAVLIVIPLVTTGVIPLSARTVVFTPPIYTPPPVPVPVQYDQGARGSSNGPTTVAHVMPITNNGPNVIRYGRTGQVIDGPEEDPTAPPTCCGGPGSGFGSGLPTGLDGNHSTVVGPPHRISVLSEALLINKVIPEYPQHGIVQGDVRLHAIISRDGSVQSLSLISGHPLLAQAAIAAVKQWRYRPYILNGEPVEVETWITISFKRNQ